MISSRFAISSFAFAPLVAAVMLASGAAQADVSVTRGPTAIPDGEAGHAEDLTIANDHLAFSLAVESLPPWGVPRGTLVDLAAVKDGEMDLDRVAFADFIPDNWSAWPNDGKQVTVVEQSPERAVIEVARNFADAMVTTTYTLEKGSDRVHLVTEFDNRGDDPLAAIRSGYTLWPDTGYLFGVPGLGDAEETEASDALTDRMVAYDRVWAFALHAPYFDRISYQGQDMYLEHSLAPGETRRFEGWLQVVPSGDLAAVVANEIERKGLPSGRVHGQVEGADGQSPPDALVMIEREGAPYAWTLAEGGEYSLSLPVGEYRAYATAQGHSNSDTVDLDVTEGGDQTLDFDGLKGPGTLELSIKEAGSGVARDARLTLLEGQEPPVEFLGKKTFFTELDPAGHASLALAPGDYRFAINAGAGFTASQQSLEVSLASGETKQQDVSIDRLVEPNDENWYGADLHHHANILEGTTPPEVVVRAQLATDLDLTFVSDHDATTNHARFKQLSDARGVPFIASIEVSPSWGHLNPFPIDLEGELKVDPGTAPVQDVLAEARRLGAQVIPMNHPYNAYGYLRNLADGKVPGGFSPGFDLLELNAAVDNAETIAAAHRLWDQGTEVYFTAGTDTHDAWNDLTGRIRMMARVPGELTPDAFARALKAGHGYATEGPLLFPQDHGFGERLRLVEEGVGSWTVRAFAVDGLKEARLVGAEGEVVERRSLEGQNDTRLTFDVPGEQTTWVALEVEDVDGDTAWSNPLWIERREMQDYVGDSTD